MSVFFRSFDNRQSVVTSLLYITILVFSLAAAPELLQSDVSRPVWFGTTLDPQTVMTASQQLAKSLANPTSSQWQAKGDQKRTYFFAQANAQIAYRVCVPSAWDGKSKLPLVIFLHGAGNTESSYLEQNNNQMIKLADQHGYLLISPLGCQGAYGNFLRLSAPFGDSANAAKLMAQVTAESELTNELSEKDVINVLELIVNEYPVDRTAMYLTGHSMGSGGTWYIGGKYSTYWKALAPMSGPFVQQSGFPWDSLHKMSILITEGTQAPSLSSSRLLRDWMKNKNFTVEYKEVNADHPGMVPLVLPDVFDFFDRCRNNSVAVKPTALFQQSTGFTMKHQLSHGLKMTVPCQFTSRNTLVSIFDITGKAYYSGIVSTISDQTDIHGIILPAGAYYAKMRTDGQNGLVKFLVAR